MNSQHASFTTVATIDDNDSKVILSKPILDVLNSEIESSIEAKSYFIALLGIMTGIDILGSSLNLITSGEKGGTRNRFNKFCRKHLLHHLGSNISADDLYSLRNGMTHQFLPINTERDGSITSLALCYDESKSRKMSDGIIKINIRELYEAYKKSIVEFFESKDLENNIKIQNILSNIYLTNIDGSDVSTVIRTEK